MGTLVNDNNHSLANPCGHGVLGVKECSLSDYQSWRRVAVSLRKTMLEGKYQGHVDLYERVLQWLGKWVDESELEGVSDIARSFKLSRTEADPALEDLGRFHREPGVFQGGFGPLNSEWQYNDLTDQLLAYVTDGNNLYEQARDAGVVKKVDAELASAEKRKTAFFPPWVVPVSIFTGIVVLGTWVYSKIASARAGRMQL